MQEELLAWKRIFAAQERLTVEKAVCPYIPQALYAAGFHVQPMEEPAAQWWMGLERGCSPWRVPEGAG